MSNHDDNECIRVGIIGGSGTGKTTLMRKIVVNKLIQENIQYIYFYTNINQYFKVDINRKIEEYIWNRKVYDDERDEHVELFDSINEIKNTMLINSKSKTKKLTVFNVRNNIELIPDIMEIHSKTQIRGIVIFDDFLDPDISKNENIVNLFGSGRHSNLDIIFNSQGGTRVISRFMYGNLTHLFLFKVHPLNVKHLFNGCIPCSDPDKPDKEFKEWKQICWKKKHAYVAYDLF